MVCKKKTEPTEEHHNAVRGEAAAAKAVAEVVEQEGEENEEEEGEREAGVGKERPKLDDGFYEIEDVRGKRVRKGQTQYLIKWRGWPETANTWEPFENLVQCSDVIEAFEDSLRVSKSRCSRKRKRKSGGFHTQTKKKQRVATGLQVLKFGDKPLPSAPSDNSSLVSPAATADGAEMGKATQGNHSNKRGDVVSVEGIEHLAENRSVNISMERKPNNQANEADPRVSELKAMTPNNGGNDEKFSTSFPDAKISEDGPTNGISKVESMEPAQSSLLTGAKKRKSGCVRRFKQDLASGGPGNGENPFVRSTIEHRNRIGPVGIDDAESNGDNMCNKNKLDDSTNPYSITKIVKPIGYSANILNNVQDVTVTFLAVRSDGKEVVVDSKFLKTNNPLLLISFYEQHLHYTST
ncbi:PREDICTED: chromo domain-containing protein LHP1-like [Nelumbo nucifera]|uniref:Chromo domain-containing protein LHP1-like n=2 Tax=Nelumbo nucifera TaxID=4432 RepID=A0A1U8B6J7_NELNU|nr:PREDICTED: chromo domain-containing protein LHP1-like [Nelumbo nucifera]DAD25052.1 TPA_asm: hypothetical protein HUJ06_026516 [Nelumbo nucifera]